MKTRRIVAALAGLTVAGLSGCQSVREGPAKPHDGQRGIIRGEEPEPELIPQKAVTPGKSSLRKTAPDR